MSSNEVGDIILSSSADDGEVGIEPTKIASDVAMVPIGATAATRLGRRKVGGINSGGKTSGNLSPIRTTSHRCIANTNSSQDSRPSASISDNALKIIMYGLDEFWE